MSRQCQAIRVSKANHNLNFITLNANPVFVCSQTELTIEVFVYIIDDIGVPFSTLLETILWVLV